MSINSGFNSGRPKVAGLHLSNYKAMSDEEFANVGINQIAYICDSVDDNMPYAICSADGNVLAEAEDLEMAQALVYGNGLVPVSLH
jgi:hypothetical protein